jgi:hypothetical protein
MVVIGFSDIAKSIIISESKKRKIDIVIIDNEYSLANEEFSSLRSNVFYIWGDFSDSKVLTLASVTKAESIIVITEQDSCNLRTVSHIRSLMSDVKTRKEPIKAYIKVDCHVFWREITQSVLFKRMEKEIVAIPFNLPVIAARHFIWHCPLFVYADLQNQSRVHSVFIGFNEYAESLFEKLLSSCIYKTLEEPYFTILVSNIDNVEKHIISKYPGLDFKSIIHFIEYKTERDCLNSSLIKKIKKITPITAIFIFSKNDDIALCHTINIRNEVTRCTISSPPIFIQMPHARGMKNLISMSPNIKDSLRKKRFEDILAPYGLHNDICQLDSIDGSFGNSIEDYACELHECYKNINDQQISSDKNTSKESLKSWSRLDETFREANRRAIDHIPAKLTTAGCFVSPGFSLKAVNSFQLTKSSEEI